MLSASIMASKPLRTPSATMKPQTEEGILRIKKGEKNCEAFFSKMTALVLCVLTCLTALLPVTAMADEPVELVWYIRFVPWHMVSR